MGRPRSRRRSTRRSSPGPIRSAASTRLGPCSSSIWPSRCPGVGYWRAWWRRHGGVRRNARVHGEFVFVKSTFGYAFWQGNCALSEGTDKVVRPSVEKKLAPRGSGLQAANRALWEARHEAGYLDDIALTKADYRTLAR